MSLLRRLGRQPGALQIVEHGDAGGAGQGVAPESGAMQTGVQLVSHRLAEAGRTHGHPASDGLAQAEDVGHEVVVLAGKQAPGAAEARLDLIHHKQRSLLAAELSQPQEVLPASRPHSPLALHHLHHHGGGIGRHGSGHGLQVVVGDVADAGDERLERLAIGLLPGEAEAAEGAAMEAAHGAHNAGAPSGHAGELKGRLYGLGARIAEEGVVQPGRRHGGQLFQQQGPLVVVEGLRAGDQRPALVHDGLDHVRVAVAQVGNAVAADAVDVLATAGVPHPRA